MPAPSTATVECPGGREKAERSTHLFYLGGKSRGYRQQPYTRVHTNPLSPLLSHANLSLPRLSNGPENISPSRAHTHTHKHTPSFVTMPTYLFIIIIITKIYTHYLHFYTTTRRRFLMGVTFVLHTQ